VDTVLLVFILIINVLLFLLIVVPQLSRLSETIAYASIAFWALLTLTLLSLGLLWQGEGLGRRSAVLIVGGYILFATDWIGLSANESPLSTTGSGAAAGAIQDFNHIEWITDRLQQAVVNAIVLARTMRGKIEGWLVAAATKPWPSDAITDDAKKPYWRERPVIYARVRVADARTLDAVHQAVRPSALDRRPLPARHRAKGGVLLQSRAKLSMSALKSSTIAAVSVGRVLAMASK